MTPPTICVAFRHTLGAGLWARVVRAIAGPPVHCMLITTGLTGWHATQGVGVERVTLTQARIAAEAWELIPVEGVDVLQLQRWCTQRLGARYDLLGALLYWTPLTTRDRWTCSEFAAEALVACGLEPGLLNHSQTPRRLRAALRERLRTSPRPPIRRAA